MIPLSIWLLTMTINLSIFFMTFGTCLPSFHQTIRSIIIVNGTYVFTTYKHGNNQHTPYALELVILKNDASWKWFLTKLHKTIMTF